MVNIDGMEGDREHSERVHAGCRYMGEKGQYIVEWQVEPEKDPIALSRHDRYEREWLRRRSRERDLGEMIDQCRKDRYVLGR